jgi:short-subunit dehydrogenase
VRPVCARKCGRLFDDALKALGSVDIFIANAGFAYFEAISQPDWAHIEKIYRVNVFNAIYAVEKMQALNGDRSHKTVITASAMAHIAVPGYALYSSTKAALDRFADGYRWQMADPRSLMLVYPIATRTGFFNAAGSGVPTPWPSQTPDEVAQAILRGIARDQKSVYPSSIFRLVLFLDRFLPMHWLVQKIEQDRFVTWKKHN